MPWAMAASAAVSYLGSKMSAKAGEKTAKNQMAMQAAQNERNDQAYAEQKQMVGGWMDAGRQALEDLQQGLQSGKYDPGQFHFDYKTFEKDPGYQFRIDEGSRMLEQGAAARGKLLSGQQQKALQNYGQNAASQEYQNSYGRAVGQYGLEANRLQNNYNMMNSLSQQGMNAAGQLGQFRSNLMGAQQQGTNNMMSAQQSQGQAQQAPYNAMAGIGSNLAGQAFQNYLNQPQTPAATAQPAGVPYQGTVTNDFGQQYTSNP